MTFLNIAAYKFIKLDELPTLRTAIKARARENNLQGTVLLSTEGINLMLAGLPEKINCFRKYLHKEPGFSDLSYKETFSSEQTYNRLLVKIKKEIIAFGRSEINPVQKKAAYITPADLKKLLDQNSDIYLLDTRNDYEIESGTFKNARHLNIQHFRDFPRAAKQLDEELKAKTIITFCTGGIRCEKAALLLETYGFQHVYQLQGGILDYLKICGPNNHYQGQCFVFDKRINIDNTEDIYHTHA